MVKRKMTPSKKTGIVLKYIWTKFRKRPIFLNLEVTKRCNARCKHCDYWKGPHEGELEDYVPVIQKINPLIVSFTGGEPLVRKDIFDLIQNMRARGGLLYLILVTNGALLNLEKAERLKKAGINQLSVSLDFLDGRHDQTRGIKGLYAHLSNLLPGLSQIGFDHVALNTVIMENNLDQITQIAEQAWHWGLEVSYSSYCDMKNNDRSLWVHSENSDKLKKIVGRLIRYKSWLGNIANSTYYLKRIPTYFEKGKINGCLAGQRWLQVTPDGHLKPCSELPVIGHFEEFPLSRERVSCQSCWYSCRGEAQAPVSLRRLTEIIGSVRNNRRKTFASAESN
jgi:MoaA/NifB/PqqE/SkfB family radical SAM enzyme